MGCLKGTASMVCDIAALDSLGGLLDSLLTIVFSTCIPGDGPWGCDYDGEGTAYRRVCARLGPFANNFPGCLLREFAFAWASTTRSAGALSPQVSLCCSQATVCPARRAVCWQGAPRLPAGGPSLRASSSACLGRSATKEICQTLSASMGKWACRPLGA
jgi:hypothetical protein